MRYGTAVGSAGLALLARVALDPLLLDQVPFITFFAGVAVTAWLGGMRPALLNVLLGFVAAEALCVQHSHPWWMVTPLDLAVAGSYFMVALIIVFAIEAQHEAHARADARQIDLEREIGERIRAEEGLRAAHEMLEYRIRLRTAELNHALNEQERERQRFEEVLDRLPVVVTLLTPDHHIAFANRMSRERFGEANGRHCFETMFGLNAPCEFCENYRVLETNLPHQWECANPDGRLYQVFALPYINAEGSTLILDVKLDITDRKRFEQALVQRTAELERSNVELQQFAYVASHDLQEPLRIVANFTQLLAERYAPQLDSDAKEFIAFAVGGAVRMQTLIQDLLAYARVGTRGGSFEPVDCNEALSRAESNLQTSIVENAARVTHEDLPVIVADAAQLVRLFQNLVGNGIKFKGASPPMVHVSAVRKGDDWLFAVRDNGIGISPQYFERIFVIFQRLHRSDEYPGTGIGLAVCKKIVERHGGTIWLESEPGRGSTFFFSIPAGIEKAGFQAGQATVHQL